MATQATGRARGGRPARSAAWPPPPSATPPTATSWCAAVEGRLGCRCACSSGEEEARLSFVGATRTLAQPATGTIAVVDVGGGSTEIAVGAPGRTRSSGRSPSASARASWPTATCAATRRRWPSWRRFAGTWPACSRACSPPPADGAVAVGGTATSLRRLVGAELAHETLERGVRVLSATPDRRGRPSGSSSTPSACGCCPPASCVLEAVSDCLRPAAADRPRRAARGRDPRDGGRGLSGH